MAVVSWKDILRLEWSQVFGRRRERSHQTLFFAPAGAEDLKPALQKGLPLKPPPPGARVIHDLEAARLRHMMRLARQRLYHGARTNCRWHESWHQAGALRHKS